ncbi:hypothetical protein [Halobaculum lipolyticum]|uniref:Uncharacterized protein n=1 Tax=Halobaculum lipolyticum TaxID=3032001 RepID=A0ABD5WDG0_9EURY|nr:hypothetical protein [Halobaculum sp. DT31]
MSQQPQQPFGQYSTVPAPQAGQQSQEPVQQIPQAQQTGQQIPGQQAPGQQIPQGGQQIPSQQIPQGGQQAPQTQQATTQFPQQFSSSVPATRQQAGQERAVPQSTQQIPQSTQQIPQSTQPTQQATQGQLSAQQPVAPPTQPSVQPQGSSLGHVQSQLSTGNGPQAMAEPQQGAQSQQGAQALAPQVPQSGSMAGQADGQQVATALQELERTLDQANVYALENGRPLVARIAEDLSELTETERKLILRQSPFAESFRQSVSTSLQQAVQQLQQQPDDPAFQEVVGKIQQAIVALEQVSMQQPASTGQMSQASQQPSTQTPPN